MSPYVQHRNNRGTSHPKSRRSRAFAQKETLLPMTSTVYLLFVFLQKQIAHLFHPHKMLPPTKRNFVGNSIFSKKEWIWPKIILKIYKDWFWILLKHILFEPLTSTWSSKASLGELLDFQHPWLQLGAMVRYLFTQDASCDHIFWSMILVKLTRDRKPPKWWLSKGNPLISGKSRLVKYYNLARWLF